MKTTFLKLALCSLHKCPSVFGSFLTILLTSCRPAGSRRRCPGWNAKQSEVTASRSLDSGSPEEKDGWRGGGGCTGGGGGCIWRKAGGGEEGSGVDAALLTLFVKIIKTLFFQFRIPFFVFSGKVEAGGSSAEGHDTEVGSMILLFLIKCWNVCFCETLKLTETHLNLDFTLPLPTQCIVRGQMFLFSFPCRSRAERVFFFFVCCFFFFLERREQQTAPHLYFFLFWYDYWVRSILWFYCRVPQASSSFPR